MARELVPYLGPSSVIVKSQSPAEGPKAIFPSGASSRKRQRDYRLSPKELNEAAISRFEFGVAHGHAADNWKKGKDDPAFQADRLNHAMNHLTTVIDGSGGWQDVEAAICNLSMLTWWRVNGTGFGQAFPHLLEKDGDEHA